jgi:two-component system, cell cycle response regulator CpdR
MEQHQGRILLVDDEASIRLTLSTLLQRRGYLVTCAARGEDALPLLDREHFDLLLLDLKMPGISGVQVAQYARAMRLEAQILVLTGTATIDNANAIEQIGFEVLLKTASPQAVLARVAAVLGHPPE